MKKGKLNRNWLVPHLNGWLLLILGFTLISNQLFSQIDKKEKEPGAVSYEIQWLGQIPATEPETKTGFGRRVVDVILGVRKEMVKKPVSISAEDPQNIWFLDQGNQTLMSSTDDELAIPRVIRRSGTKYPSLIDMCQISSGDLLFTDSRNNEIYRLGKDEDQISIFGREIVFNQPTGIAYNMVTNEVWVIETQSHQISILDEQGNLLQKIGKRGTGQGEFNFPTHIWIDNQGRVYVSDAMNYRIQILDQQGNFISMFGTPGNTTGSFARPKGVATDSFGNIYVVDALFHAVQIFQRDGTLLHYFGSFGQDKEQFWLPTGIFIDNYNYIYIADTYNSRIQIYQVIETHTP